MHKATSSDNSHHASASYLWASQATRVLTGESPIMSLSKGLIICIFAALLVSSATTYAADAGIGCPPTHDGKRLKDVQLFEGSPENKIEIVPDPGRFVVPQTPRSLWARFPPFTLGCTYSGSKEMVTVVLPRSVRVCEFTNGPQVRCH
jgi:hypothetical protein